MWETQKCAAAVVLLAFMSCANASKDSRIDNPAIYPMGNPLPLVRLEEAKDGEGVPQFEHLKWKAGIRFAWNTPYGKEARVLHVSRDGETFYPWGVGNAGYSLEPVESDKAAFELAFHFYPGWGKVVALSSWHRIKELCAGLQIPERDQAKGPRWIVAGQRDERDFEVRIVREEDAFRISYVAWSWKQITAFDLRVNRSGRIEVLGKKLLLYVGTERPMKQVMVGPGSEPDPDPERVLLERFTEGERRIFLDQRD